MPKQEYELYSDALSARDGRTAGDIADGAHGRVCDTLNGLIEDESTPPNAIPVLKRVLNNFRRKAEKRLDQAYSEQDQKRLVNRGV